MSLTKSAISETTGDLIRVLNFSSTEKKEMVIHLSFSLLLTENAASMWDGLSFVRCLVFTLSDVDTEVCECDNSRRKRRRSFKLIP